MGHGRLPEYGQSLGPVGTASTVVTMEAVEHEIRSGGPDGSSPLNFRSAAPKGKAYQKALW